LQQQALTVQQQLAENWKRIENDRAQQKADDDHAASVAQLPGVEADAQQKVARRYSSLLANSKDQADYDAKRNKLPFGVARQFPDQFDKQAILNAGMTPEQQTTTDLTRKGQAITLRGQNITMRGQNMTDARMRDNNQIQRDTKMDAKRSQAQTVLTGVEADFDRLATAANELLQHSGLGGITGLRGAVGNIPGSRAADAQAKLETLKSQVGFGVLQNMRNQSKTGGALGQVSDREISLLTSNLAALDKSQSKEQMQESLRKIIDYANGAKQRARSAFQGQFSGVGNTGTAQQQSVNNGGFDWNTHPQVQ
jgi:hypothetical protein